MKNKTLKQQIKVGTILYDDTQILYEVVDIMTNTCVVEVIHDRTKNYSCELITFRAMESEKWVVVK